MIADFILIFAGLTGLLAASVFDLKTREVPDWLNFSLIAAGIGVRLIYSLQTKDWFYMVYGLIGSFAFFLFGLLMYYAKQWGGGDVKMAAALGALFATAPFFVKESFPFLLLLLFNILIAGAVYGLLWTGVLAFRHRKKLLKEFKKMLCKDILMKTAGSLIFLFFLVAIISFFNRFIYWPVAAFTVAVIFIYFLLFPAIKAVENVCMYKWLPLNKLTEGDWVAREVKVKGKVVCGPKDLGLEQWQIEKLKKARVKKVLVKEGIPFIPSFLVGTVLTLIFGNLLF